jgi:hypothetical protein
LPVGRNSGTASGVGAVELAVGVSGLLCAIGS